ncbi:MAG TPA: hypothetical protein VK543_19120, partial [Puia sp.]|nr:hypothetical protein [Puia sp.]
NFQEAAVKMQAVISKYENIFGVVIYGDFVDPNVSLTEGDEFQFICKKMINEVICRNLFFVRNVRFNQSLSTSSIKLIYESFGQ